MKTHEKLGAMILCAVICALFLSAFIGAGCAMTTTHYQIKGDYEMMARQNVLRGRGPLCVSGKKTVRIEDVTFWMRVLDNWQDYGKALALDLLIAGTSWYAYDQKDNDKKEVTNIYQSYYYQTETPAPATTP